jgi:hypothetical protein
LPLQRAAPGSNKNRSKLRHLACGTLPAVIFICEGIRGGICMLPRPETLVKKAFKCIELGRRSRGRLAVNRPGRICKHEQRANNEGASKKQHANIRAARKVFDPAKQVRANKA